MEALGAGHEHVLDVGRRVGGRGTARQSGLAEVGGLSALLQPAQSRVASAGIFEAVKARAQGVGHLVDHFLEGFPEVEGAGLGSRGRGGLERLRDSEWFRIYNGLRVPEEPKPPGKQIVRDDARSTEKK